MRPVGRQVAQVVSQVFFLFLPVVLHPEELGRGTQRQRRSALHAALPCHGPAFAEPLLVHFILSLGRVRYQESPFSSLPPYAVAHHEVPLVPVQDAGQRHLLHQLLQRDAHPLRAEPDALRRLADAQHGHALAGDVAPFP